MVRAPLIKSASLRFAIWFWFAAFSACSAGSAKSHYILAEKLWTDGKYASAVSEFDKTAQRDPRGKLGLQALFRAASTQSLFLSQYEDAVKKFRLYVELSEDTPEAWEAQKQIGEILFSKTDQYDLAIQQYKALLKARPDAAETPEFLYRIAKAHFFLQQFDEALDSYRDLIKRYPATLWSEQAAYEIGLTAFTRGEQRPGGKGPGMESYQEATEAYQAFLKKYPQSTLVPQARFGIASCLEELDQLDAAYQAYEALKDTYPSRNVIEIKLARIRERRAERNR
jgi:TolA-binding protein